MSEMSDPSDLGRSDRFDTVGSCRRTDDDGAPHSGARGIAGLGEVAAERAGERVAGARRDRRRPRGDKPGAKKARRSSKRARRARRA